MLRFKSALLGYPNKISLRKLTFFQCKGGYCKIVRFQINQHSKTGEISTDSRLVLVIAMTSVQLQKNHESFTERTFKFVRALARVMLHVMLQRLLVNREKQTLLYYQFEILNVAGDTKHFRGMLRFKSAILGYPNN